MGKRKRKSNYQIRQENRDWFSFMYSKLCCDFVPDESQREQIVRGIRSRLYYEQIKVYADPKFSGEQMKQIRLGWKMGLAPEQIAMFAWMNLDANQMKEIRLGLEHGLSNIDVSKYANSRYSCIEMMKKRTELERLYREANQLADSDITEEINSQSETFSLAQLHQIQAGLKNKKVARGEHLFRNNRLTVKQMIQIQVGLENGLPLEQVAFYAHHKYNDLQMAQLRRGFENGLPLDSVKEYANKNISASEMRTQREEKEALISQINILKQCDPPKGENDEANRQPREKKTKGAPQPAPKSRKPYFPESLIQEVQQHSTAVWELWSQTKQVFIFEDALADSLLNNAMAINNVSCEVLQHSPFPSAYIVAKEAPGAALEFFAALINNTLSFRMVQGGSLGLSCDLPIATTATGKELLASVEDLLIRSEVAKMLQLYACLCASEPEIMTVSREMLPAVNAGGYSSCWNQQLQQGVPRWDVNTYTVTQQAIKRQYRCKRSSDDVAAPRKPHIRRGHWHHFWVGSRNDAASRRLVLKWVPETKVNQTEDELPVRIILVRNDYAR